MRSLSTRSPGSGCRDPSAGAEGIEPRGATESRESALTSFAGESQARNRYTFFAATARKEGLQQIAAIFDETAQQESAHAKRLFKFLEGGPGGQSVPEPRDP